MTDWTDPRLQKPLETKPHIYWRNGFWLWHYPPGGGLKQRALRQAVVKWCLSRNSRRS